MNNEQRTSAADKIDQALQDIKEVVKTEFETAGVEALEDVEEQIQLLEDIIKAVDASKVEMLSAVDQQIGFIKDEVGKRHEQIIKALAQHVEKLEVKRELIKSPQ
jgi:hypothetical protein